MNDTSWERPAIYFVYYILLFFAGDSMGVLLGSMFNDPRMAMGVFPVVYTPYIITGGFLSTSSNFYSNFTTILSSK